MSCICTYFREGGREGEREEGEDRERGSKGGREGGGGREEEREQGREGGREGGGKEGTGVARGR